MRALFPDQPEVVENAARREFVRIRLREALLLPQYPRRRSSRPITTCSCIWRGRGGGALRGPPAPGRPERLDYELQVISHTGYAGYFLIVYDIVKAAKDRGIPVGRGALAAGSLVAYALGITDIDPLKFDLLFERFLNPERISMPDIDLDFCFERRGEVIQYIREAVMAGTRSTRSSPWTLKARARSATSRGRCGSSRVRWTALPK